MGGSSSSKTQRTYNTTNYSQQGEGNVHGNNNRVTIERADAKTLDNIAKALEAGIEDISQAGTEQTVKTLEAAEQINADSLDFAEGVNADALDANTDVLGQALQFTENSSQRAMDFVDNYTEREQVGNDANATRSVVYVAGMAGLALVGVAWASKGGMKA